MIFEMLKIKMYVTVSSANISLNKTLTFCLHSNYYGVTLVALYHSREVISHTISRKNGNFVGLLSTTYQPFNSQILSHHTFSLSFLLLFFFSQKNNNQKKQIP